LLFVKFIFGFVISTEIILKITVLSIISSTASIFFFRTYKEIIRHSSLLEGGRIAFTSLLKSFFLIVSTFFLIELKLFSILFAGYVIDFLITFLLLLSSRIIFIFSYRYLSETSNQVADKDNLLVFDTAEQPSFFLESFNNNIKRSYHITGYIRMGRKNHLRINGYHYFSISDKEEFEQLVSSYNIRAILFPSHAAVKDENDRLVSYCEENKIKMLISPSVNEIKGEKINYRNLPEVRIEDLLQREEISINMLEIANSLDNKSVMVTGAAGSIGSELCRQLVRFGLKQLILFDNAETAMYHVRLDLENNFPGVTYIHVIGDIRNSKCVDHILKTYCPDIIFHAAAYKHVPLMEENPSEAIYTNVYGTMLLADSAVKHNVKKFIMISTDKAVNPTNIMGASKRIAEMYVQSLSLAISKGKREGNTRFITTRFGNVLGSNGSVIPHFREQLAKGGPLTVTHPEIIRYFMTIPEACRLVLEAAFMGKGNEIFIFDMGEPVRIVDLAQRMIKLSGLEPDKDIKIVFTGLRPGEKLYEELLNAKEKNQLTNHKKIFRAKVREYDYNVIYPQIINLCNTAINMNFWDTVKQMKQLVPEFKSQQSRYEYLDKKLLL